MRRKITLQDAFDNMDMNGLIKATCRVYLYRVLRSSLSKSPKDVVLTDHVLEVTGWDADRLRASQ